MSDETTISETKVVARRRWWESLALIASWIWTIIAGGGGLPRLFEKGPLPLTNGWFALMSGISACPLTSWLLKKYPGIPVQWLDAVWGRACLPHRGATGTGLRTGRSTKMLAEETSICLDPQRSLQ